MKNNQTIEKCEASFRTALIADSNQHSNCYDFMTFQSPP